MGREPTAANYIVALDVVPPRTGRETRVSARFFAIRDFISERASARVPPPYAEKLRALAVGFNEAFTRGDESEQRRNDTMGRLKILSRQRC